ncbi:hypothetical protein SALBM311S_07931 [Streptomyces alboniger]
MTATGLEAAGHPLLGAAVALADADGFPSTGRLSVQTHPWLADHALAAPRCCRERRSSSSRCGPGTRSGVAGGGADVAGSAGAAGPGRVRVQVTVGARDETGRAEPRRATRGRTARATAVGPSHATGVLAGDEALRVAAGTGARTVPALLQPPRSAPRCGRTRAAGAGDRSPAAPGSAPGLAAPGRTRLRRARPARATELVWTACGGRPGCASPRHPSTRRGSLPRTGLRLASPPPNCATRSPAATEAAPARQRHLRLPEPGLPYGAHLATALPLDEAGAAGASTALGELERLGEGSDDRPRRTAARSRGSASGCRARLLRWNDGPARRPHHPSRRHRHRGRRRPGPGHGLRRGALRGAR